MVKKVIKKVEVQFKDVEEPIEDNAKKEPLTIEDSVMNSSKMLKNVHLCLNSHLEECDWEKLLFSCISVHGAQTGQLPVGNGY